MWILTGTLSISIEVSFGFSLKRKPLQMLSLEINPHKICALLECYIVQVGILLPTVRDCLTFEDRTDRLLQTVGNKLPTCTA